MKVHNGRLHKGRAHPLNPAFLKNALAAANITTRIELHRRCEAWWIEGVLLRLDFYPPTMGAPVKGDTIHVTCRSVRTEDRDVAAAFLETEAVPVLVKWIVDFEHLPENAPVKREQPSYVVASGF
jgi:hypothetical protein